MHAYRISGLDPALFDSCRSLDAAALARCGARRVVADSDSGYPCRISLENARTGESLLLLPFEHHPVSGPYRASGPIFIRECATQRNWMDDAVPESFLRRLLSVRAYDAEGEMRDADVAEGTQLEALIQRLLDDTQVDYLHIHNARRGCYAARVTRQSRRS